VRGLQFPAQSQRFSSKALTIIMGSWGMYLCPSDSPARILFEVTPGLTEHMTTPIWWPLGLYSKSFLGFLSQALLALIWACGLKWRLSIACPSFRMKLDALTYNNQARKWVVLLGYKNANSQNCPSNNTQVLSNYNLSTSPSLV
jgi:hypothetical protein